MEYEIIGIFSQAYSGQTEGPKPSIEPAESIKQPISRYDLQQALYKLPPYKQALDVFVDNVYTHPRAWAHTSPQDKRICIRPPEFLPYDKGINFDLVLGHEGNHNEVHLLGLPDGDEDRHTRLAYDQLRNSSFDYRIH